MIGIIGGSGLYKVEGIEILEEVRLKTPFGEPSSSIILGKIGDNNVAFISRHGIGHIYPPHLIPYRANLWALKELGVKRVLAISAVGGINVRYNPGDFVIIEDFMEFTKNRETTFYEGKFSKWVCGDDKPSRLIREGKVVHIDMSDPYCQQMRVELTHILDNLKYSYHIGGTYVCTEGPRFETPSEIRYMQALGGDVVGMTGYPEVVLARELEMCYASLCVVSNPAAGISKNKLTSDEVINLMKGKEEEIKTIIVEFVKRLPTERTCNCGKALEGAEV